MGIQGSGDPGILERDMIFTGLVDGDPRIQGSMDPSILERAIIFTELVDEDPGIQGSKHFRKSYNFHRAC